MADGDDIRNEITALAVQYGLQDADLAISVMAIVETEVDKRLKEREPKMSLGAQAEAKAIWQEFVLAGRAIDTDTNPIRWHWSAESPPNADDSKSKVWITRSEFFMALRLVITAENTRHDDDIDE